MVEREQADNQERFPYFPPMPARKVPMDLIPGGLVTASGLPTAEGAGVLLSPTARRAEELNGPDAGRTEKNPTVSLHGTVADSPRFRKSKKAGKDIMEFSFAVELPDGATEQVTVHFFGERVQRFKGRVNKGDERIIRGYEHRQEPKRGGKSTAPKIELYGVAVLPHE
jgi:hypothetical protein